MDNQGIEEQIYQIFNASGEKEKNKALLRQRLMESGWFEGLSNKCIEIIQQRGIDNVNIDELASSMVPFARDLIPEEIKEEILGNISAFVHENVKN